MGSFSKFGDVVSSNYDDKDSSGSKLKTGFVCLVGPTNAGKSTLMNALVGNKGAITTPKPQTTRNRILGIHTVKGRGQIVFIDTPGFHKPRHRLGERMNEVAIHSLDGVDLALLVVDVALDASGKRPAVSPANRRAIKTVNSAPVPFVAILNKVDQVSPKERLLPLIESYSQTLQTDHVIPLSALNGEGVKALETLLFDLLPNGPFLYPDDIISDQAERFLAAEILREKLMMVTHNELPYSVAVEVERWQEEPGKNGKKPLLHINAVIHVERETQKGIVIGKGGQKLKGIGTAARKELEQVFGVKVFLEVFVRVEKDWSHDPRRLDKFGY